MTLIDRHSPVSASRLSLLTAAALAVAAAAFSQAPSPQSPDLEIRYTGKLFGYYRIEPGENVAPLSESVSRSAPRASSGSQSAGTAEPSPAQRFLSANPKSGVSTSSLLLGMGDNFAPEFGASIQQEFRKLGEGAVADQNWSPCRAIVPRPDDTRVASHSLAAPQVLYKTHDRKPVLADCDNVTRFLMLAGYRAIVPGREDFIYSATWLRRIALLLHGASYTAEKAGRQAQADSAAEARMENKFLIQAQAQAKSTDPANTSFQSVPVNTWAVGDINNTDGQLYMLAANMRVSVGKESCPLLFANNLASPQACADQNNAITKEMDWFRRLQETLSAWSFEDSAGIDNSHEIEDALNRRAAGDAEYRKQLVMNEVSILSVLLKSYGCSSIDVDGKQIASEALLDLVDPYSKSDAYKSDQTTATLRLAPNGLQNQDKLFKELGNLTCTNALSSNVESSGGSATGNGSSTTPSGILTASDVTAKIQTIEKEALRSFNDALKSTATNPVGPILVHNDVRKQALRLFLNLIFIEQRNIGFTIAKLASGKSALIIGVAGKETMQQISKQNFSVIADDQDQPPAAPARDADSLQNHKEGTTAPGNKPESFDRAKFYDLTVGDPGFAVTAVLQAAWKARETQQCNNPNQPPLFDYVIVMAQMPAAEAIELGTRVHADMLAAVRSAKNRPSIDLILNEAQYGHETPNQALSVNPGELPPVLTPPDGSTYWGSDVKEIVSTAKVYDHASAVTFNIPVDGVLSRLVLNTHQDGNQYEPQVSSGNKLSSSSSAGSTQQSQAASRENGACDLTVKPDDLPQNAACQLKIELDKVRMAAHTSGEKDLDALWDACETMGQDNNIYVDRSCQNNVLMQQLLHLLERDSHADVALLERRDFYFGYLGSEYGDYKMCEEWIADAYPSDGKESDRQKDKSYYEEYCRLRVALDRVLWKGDYSQRVMVDGTTLTGLLQNAAQQTDQEQTLLANDVHDAWLMSFGIVTAPSLNLVTSTSSAYSFSIPGVDQCDFKNSPASSASGGATTYCINGQAIQTDHAYSLITSDDLAAQQSVYGALGSFVKQNPAFKTASNHLFLTAEIADQAMQSGLPSVLMADEKSPIANHHYRLPPETNLLQIEKIHQDRSLVQLDFSKVVAGFTFFHPSLSDSALAADLSGVANTQAVTPHSQELDLESAARLTFSWPESNAEGQRLNKFLTFGLQNDAEYDRKVLGNLTGNPETVTYSLNSYTAGGFAQFPVDSKFAPHPHAFIVIAPYQFQRQMTGAFLNFSYLSAAGVANSQQQLSVHAPYAWGFSQRVGFRYQMEQNIKWAPDPGSYAEIGPEYNNQNNVLSALFMPQVQSVDNTSGETTPSTCYFVATQSIQTCVKNAYKAAGIALNGSSALVSVPETLHAGGIYWTMHLQKQVPPKKSSITFDTQGDSFLWPGATLTTQERYGITTSLALNFSIFGNITLSPTYSEFFFENQGAPSQRTSVVAPTYTVVLKWYFVRDSAVPFRKQFLFTGPATSSQTSTSKLK